MKLEPLPIRMVYFGMAGAFSLPPLAALLDAGMDVRAIVLPGQAGVTPGAVSAPYRQLARPAQLSQTAPYARAPLPMFGLLAISPGVAPRTIIEVGAQRRIPVYEVNRLGDPASLALLASLAPDVICVACFSRRLPSALLRVPRLGCLNVHPSLLPDNRGPDPLFWTFRRGETHTGVTIHQMDEGFDSGPIVAQEAIAVPVGITEAALEARLAALGGHLLAHAVTGLATGALHPAPQDATYATTYGWPQDEEYGIDLRAGEWSAERAYRFACGVGGRGQALLLVAGDGARFRLIAPLGYSDDAASALAAKQPERQVGDEVWLRCAPGVLHVHALPLAQ